MLFSVSSMDDSAEFPDAELAGSRTLGSVFRIVMETPKEPEPYPSDQDDRRMRGHVRAQSAKGERDFEKCR